MAELLQGGCDGPRAFKALYDERWMDGAHGNAPTDTRYIGNNLRSASAVASIFSKNVWEHREHRGIFIVSDEYPRGIDGQESNWLKVDVGK